MRFARALAALAGLLAASALVPAAPAPARAEPRPAEALRVAAFAERILELQAQEGMGVLGPRARRAAGTALREFDASVRAIGVPAGPPELHEAAALLALLAVEYRTWAQKPPSRESARKLGERAEEVAWQATKVARLLVDDPLGAGPLAAHAEEASALVQRIARLLLWKRWGIAGGKWSDDLALAQAALEASLAALRGSAANTPEALAELQLGENQSEFLIAAAGRVARGSADPRDLETAVKASGNAHESMERLAAIHEARARGGR